MIVATLLKTNRTSQNSSELRPNVSGKHMAVGFNIVGGTAGATRDIVFYGRLPLGGNANVVSTGDTDNFQSNEWIELARWDNQDIDTSDTIALDFCWSAVCARIEGNAGGSDIHAYVVLNG